MRRVHPFRLRLLLLLCLALAGIAREADACSCVAGIPLCETFWKTPVVFAGEVLQITLDPASRNPQYPAGRLVRFRVDRAWRGGVSDRVVIHTGAGGRDCGYDFERGVKYLVYAHQRDGRLSTGICSRTRPIREATEDLEYLETAFRPAGVGRIFGKAEFQRRGPDEPVRPASGYTVTLATGGKRRQTTTRADGQYEFPDVPAGTYTIDISVSSTERAYGSRAVTLADPRRCAAADFSVVPNGRIAARVLTANHEPAAKLTLEVIELESMAAKDDGFPAVRFMEADANGLAEIDALQPKRYVVGINVTRPPEPKQPYPTLFYPGTAHVSDAVALDLNHGERVELGVWILPEPMHEQAITGVIVWPNGLPAAGAAVSLWLAREKGKYGPQVGSAIRTDGQGRFRLPAHRGQIYYVSAWAEVKERRSQWHARSAEFEVTPDLPPLILTLAPPRRPPP